MITNRDNTRGIAHHPDVERIHDSQVGAWCLFVYRDTGPGAGEWRFAGYTYSDFDGVAGQDALAWLRQ